jgi:hypothetical protein
MSALEKATLQEIKSDDSRAPIGDPIPVQFNPTTLKLQLSNTIEGNRSRGRQARQYIGSSSTTLTLDLIFDTADEGTTDNPRSVREKTGRVEQFVLPKGERKKKQVPPKVRFHWGHLIVDGIVESVTIDFDHFAADGTPLRAKVGLAIKEQDGKYQFLQAGPGANQSGRAPEPTQPAAGAPGSTGGGAGDRSALALAGESAAEFAARVGLEPAAWRGLSADLDNPLSLEAGVEIGFSADLSVAAGLGVTIGAEAGVSASLEAVFGLEVDASLSAVAGVGIGAELSAGFALSAAGGVSAAIASVQNTKSQAAAQQTRQAFALPAGGSSPAAQSASRTGGSVAIAAVGGTSSTPVRPALPEQPHPPLARTGLPSPHAQQAASPAPSLPRIDSRAASFGFGVPLRPTVGQAASHRAGAMQGHVALRPQVESGAPPLSHNPTTPPWVSLPARERSRDTADQRQHQRRPTRPCGCLGPCRH